MKSSANVLAARQKSASLQNGADFMGVREVIDFIAVPGMSAKGHQSALNPKRTYTVTAAISQSVVQRPGIV
jgi:hypothetical protein